MAKSKTNRNRLQVPKWGPSWNKLEQAKRTAALMQGAYPNLIPCASGSWPE